MKLILFLYFTTFAISNQIPLISTEDCRDLNSMSYEKCGKKEKCGLCTLNIYCGWCSKNSFCVPIDAGNKKPVCGEDCGEVLGFEDCYKASIKRFTEEIEIGGTDFERPQFTPSKYELKTYIMRDFDEEMEGEEETNDGEENKKIRKPEKKPKKTKKKTQKKGKIVKKKDKPTFIEEPKTNENILVNTAKQELAPAPKNLDQITSAKNDILTLFNKLLKVQK